MTTLRPRYRSGRRARRTVRLCGLAAVLVAAPACSDGDRAADSPASSGIPVTPSNDSVTVSSDVPPPTTAAAPPGSSAPTSNDPAGPTTTPSVPVSEPTIEEIDGREVAIPAGYPTSATTGVPAGIALEPRDGPITITEPGTVIDGWDIDGNVVVAADDVTIRNTRVTSDDRYPITVGDGEDGAPVTGFVIEDSRIVGVGACSAALGVRNFVARRVHITGCEDGVKAAGDVVIEDSLIAGLNPAPEAHNDGLQISEGTSIVVHHNSIFGPFQGATSAILVIPSIGDIDDVELTDNFLSGGSYSLYVYDDDEHTIAGVEVSGNILELGSQQFGPVADRRSGAVYSDNEVFDPAAGTSDVLDDPAS